MAPPTRLNIIGEGGGGVTGVVETKCFINTPMVRQKTTIFRFVTKIACLKVPVALGKFKPSGLSNIPSWALRDAACELAESV